MNVSVRVRVHVHMNENEDENANASVDVVDVIVRVHDRAKANKGTTGSYLSCLSLAATAIVMVFEIATDEAVDAATTALKSN